MYTWISDDANGVEGDRGGNNLPYLCKLQQDSGVKWVQITCTPVVQTH